MMAGENPRRKGLRGRLSSKIISAITPLDNYSRKHLPARKNFDYEIGNSNTGTL